MAIFNFLKIVVAAASIVGVVAHPQLSDAEMAEYGRIVARSAEALGHCFESAEMQEINARALEEHKATLQRLRKARGLSQDKELEARGFNELHHWVTVNHEKPGKGKDRDPQDLFNFHWNEIPRPNPAGCVLNPESIYGPFWLDGQPLRQNIRDGQKGIYMRLALRVINLNTCKPLWNSRVDVWHANPHGNYGPKNTSFLRGWQPSSVQGTVDFDTVFPGRYIPRTTHIHIVVRDHNSKHVVHTGQLYFDQSLIDKVESLPDYQNNPYPKTKNNDDGWAASIATNKYDPFMQWSWIGNQPTDGVLVWATMGINMSDPNIPQPGPGVPKRRGVFDDHLEY